jgi:hypothetical protein
MPIRTQNRTCRRRPLLTKNRSPVDLRHARVSIVVVDEFFQFCAQLHEPSHPLFRELQQMEAPAMKETQRDRVGRGEHVRHQAGEGQVGTLEEKIWTLVRNE